MPPQSYNFEEILQRAREIFQFIISNQLQEKLFPLKLIFIILTVFFILAIIFFLKKTSYLRDAFLQDWKDLSAFKDYGKKKWLRRWSRIKKKLENPSEAQQKLSLIEAHKMLDQVLERAGFGGKNIEERLKKLTENDVSDLSKLFEAHQVCQDIIRDPDYRLDKEKAREIIEVFEKTFQDLNLF